MVCYGIFWSDPQIRWNVALNPKSGQKYFQNRPIPWPINFLPPPPSGLISCEGCSPLAASPFRVASEVSLERRRKPSHLSFCVRHSRDFSRLPQLHGELARRPLRTLHREWGKQLWVVPWKCTDKLLIGDAVKTEETVLKNKFRKRWTNEGIRKWKDKATNRQFLRDMSGRNHTMQNTLTYVQPRRTVCQYREEVLLI